MIHYLLRHPISFIRGAPYPLIDTRHPERNGFYRRGRRIAGPRLDPRWLRIGNSGLIKVRDNRPDRCIIEVSRDDGATWDTFTIGDQGQAANLREQLRRYGLDPKARRRTDHQTSNAEDA